MKNFNTKLISDYVNKLPTFIFDDKKIKKINFMKQVSLKITNAIKEYFFGTLIEENKILLNENNKKFKQAVIRYNEEYIVQLKIKEDETNLTLDNLIKNLEKFSLQPDPDPDSYKGLDPDPNEFDADCQQAIRDFKRDNEDVLGVNPKFTSNFSVIGKLPRILIFNLILYNLNVKYNVTLDYQSFLNPVIKNKKFLLYGINVHKGESIKSGHYISYIRSYNIESEIFY